MQKPDRSKLRYNEKAMREASKRPTIPYEPGNDWYPFLVIDTEEIVGDTDKTRGDMVITAQCAALSDIADPTTKIRPVMRERLTVPAGNPDYPGHEAKEYHYGLARRFLLAVMDPKELQRPPYRDPKTKKLMYKGKVIEPVDADGASEEVMEATVKLAEDLYFEGSSDLKNRVFLGKVGPDKKGEGYTNILQTRHVDLGLPKGADWGPAYKAGNGATHAAAPARRKARKKKGKKTKR